MSEAADRGVELMEFVAKALVSNPDDVKVDVSDDGRTLELNTADDDRGRVIGRQGRVAKAMRALLEPGTGLFGPTPRYRRLGFLPESGVWIRNLSRTDVIYDGPIKPLRRPTHSCRIGLRGGRSCTQRGVACSLAGRWP